jgi:hypothetical protein
MPKAKRQRTVIGGAAALLLAGAVMVFVALQRRTPSSDYELSASQVAEAQSDAWAGDVEASGRLAMFCLISQSDERAALPWIRLAAKQGDLQYRKLLLDILSLSTAQSDKDEAKLLSRQWGSPR